MKFLRPLFLLLFLACSTIGFAQLKLDAKKLDKKLAELQALTKTVGFSVAIVHKDELIYAKGFGYRDLENKLKADENTLFAIGSSSKAFTTALLGAMEAEGDFSFEDNPSDYLPNLKFYNNELNNQLKVLDMVSHRSGLPRHDFSWYLFPTQNRDSLLARVEFQEPFSGLRQNWYYNNFMFLAQGMIAEKISGKSWEANIESEFFNPLEMSRSNLSISALEQDENASKGYGLDGDSKSKVLPYYDIAAMGPAGSINSSAKEMANWLKLWLNEGNYNDQEVLPASYIRKAQNPLMLIGSGISDPQFPDIHLASYGYGWFIASYKGHYRMEHGGNIDGFSANVSLFPEDDLGIVILCNQNGSSLPPLARNLISDMLLDLNKTNWHDLHKERLDKAKNAEEETQENEAETEIPGSSVHLPEEYQGFYHHPGYGRFKVFTTNDSLFAKFPIKKAYLKPKFYDIFDLYFMEDDKVDIEAGSSLKLNFQTNNLGDIQGVNIKFEPTLEALSFKRKPLDFELSPAELETLVGAYHLSGISIQISVKDGVLMALVPGQPEYSLIPIADKEFRIEGLQGYKVKFEAQEENMNMILMQPNGTFTAKRE